MHERSVACPDRFHGGAGGQHCGRPVELVNPVDVPSWGPAVQTAVVCQPELLLVDDEYAVGQLTEQCRVGDAGPVDKATLPVQHLVDVVRRRFRGKGAGRCPGRPERLIGGVAAFRAGPVPGGQRDGLVEEEQFGIAAGPHDGPPTAAELQHAHQPAADLVAPHQGQVLVVEHTPVAVHGPAVLSGDQLARGRHPIPQRTLQASEPVAVGHGQAFLGHGFSAPSYGQAVWRFPDGIVLWWAIRRVRRRDEEPVAKTRPETAVASHDAARGAPHIGYATDESSVPDGRSTLPFGTILNLTFTCRLAGQDGVPEGGPACIGRRSTTGRHRSGRPEALGASDTERMFNAFAAHLLMPRSSVLSIWDEFAARSPRLAAIAVAVRFSVSWTAACNQLRNLGLIDSRERERLLGDDLRRGELFEFGERFAVELDPPSVPPAYARVVVSAYRKGQLTAARTVELLHRSVGEADLPEPDAMSLDELRREFETGL